MIRMTCGADPPNKPKTDPSDHTRMMIYRRPWDARDFENIERESSTMHVSKMFAMSLLQPKTDGTIVSKFCMHLLPERGHAIKATTYRNAVYEWY